MLGAICGDILGSTYEFEEMKSEEAEGIRLCLDTDSFTDDSVLTFAVADWLLHDIEKDYFDDEALKISLAKQFVKYSVHTFEESEGMIGFGTRYFHWCAKADLIGEYQPYNSCGNGSGMRVSPVG